MPARPLRTSAVGGELSGFLTGNSNADLSQWAELEQGFINELQTADPAAFDGSDNMPAEVGSGTFRTEATSFVNGDVDAETATANIEAPGRADPLSQGRSCATRGAVPVTRMGSPALLGFT